MAWTYILRCADGSYYVGSTRDLDRRLWEHNEGLGAAHTRRPARRPVVVAWSAQFDRVDDAFHYEKKLQNWSRAKREALIRGELDLLPVLSKRPRARRRAEERLDRGAGE